MTCAEWQRLYLRRDLWRQQRRICDAIETKPLVTVKSCHASGKTYNAAGIALWWLHRYRDSRVYWLAPTLRQVKMGFDEIALAIKQASCSFPIPTTTAVRKSEQNFIQGFSAAKSVNAQGPHAPNVLIITDEAPGIQADVWDALEGIRSGGNVKLLKLGNPVVPGGPFFEDFGRAKAAVEGITISAFDTPNLQGLTQEQLVQMNDDELDTIKSPYLVRRRWVREMYFKWGPQHPSYQSRVLGNFPAQSKFAVFNSEWVTRAARELTDQHWIDCKQWSGVLQVGIDVAGAGEDETACCARIGQLVIAQDAWGDADARGPVSLFLSSMRVKFPKARIVVMVDVTGVGHYMAKHIADQQYDTYGFVAGGRAIDPTSFINAKAEAYDALAKWMERGIYGVEDLDTQGQLIGVQFKPTNTGQIQIEPKDEAKKRGLSSPDRAEALVLAFAPVVLRNQTITWQERASVHRPV